MARLLAFAILGVLWQPCLCVVKSDNSLPNVRPPLANRTFTSQAVENYIAQLSSQPWRDPNLNVLFSNCFPNVLDRAVLRFTPDLLDPDAFIVTGDIPAMWLRDTLGELAPYFKFARAEKKLGDLLRGALRRLLKSVLLDSYANAFSLVESTGQPSPNANDKTAGMVMGVFERKYELDSLAAVLKFGNMYYESTDDPIPFRDGLWERAVKRILSTLRAEQQVDGSSPYSFQRQAFEPTDTLSHGNGWPAAYTGMVRTAFRPSDDAVTFPFNIPANAMIAVELNRTAALVSKLLDQPNLASQVTSLSGEIADAVWKHGVFSHPVSKGRVFAYEVDGMGNAYFADDANVPSLLSLPFLGFLSEANPIYLETRTMLLSTQTNPWFFSGTAPAGIGGPHVGVGYVWPMSLIVQALTSINDTRTAELLDELVLSSAGTGLMHESYWLDNVTQFTRPWFGWANSLLAELILKLSKEKPSLLFHNTSIVERLSSAAPMIV
eukprot:TRINITY_DN48666_c0_g1_i1.p1 TRINITY_DN48666_c0_g1~~TRINITY_DN48666_c0_g1_i1.p1  ORF type:complete len:514 (-),score=53.67 TRINITY_DN48666_c0_g1_i1:73-1551(-)